MSLKCILSVLKYNNVFMYIVYMYTYTIVCCPVLYSQYDDVYNGAIKGCNLERKIRRKIFARSTEAANCCTASGCLSQ